jgi:hypothetical protein
MKRSLLAIAIIALYLLHQDFWFWRAAAPIVFGFLPIGLFYHICYTLVISVLMWALVKYAWPSHLEDDPPVRAEARAIREPHSLKEARTD